jgi:hypothetical protein
MKNNHYLGSEIDLPFLNDCLVEIIPQYKEMLFFIHVKLTFELYSPISRDFRELDETIEIMAV